MFSAPSLRNESTLNVSDYRGKVLYLEFWASWCPSCWDAFPKLEKIRKEFREEGLEGLEVIGVNVNDDFADALEASNHLRASFPLVRPDTDEVMHAYGIKAMPYGVLIDRKGVVRSVYLGLDRLDQRELKIKIRTLLWKGL